MIINKKKNILKSKSYTYYKIQVLSIEKYIFIFKFIFKLLTIRAWEKVENFRYFYDLIKLRKLAKQNIEIGHNTTSAILCYIIFPYL